MANRRMLSRTVIESGEFEELSHIGQLLYMRMNLIADDDGFAECYALSRMLGVGQNEFDELAASGFVNKVQGRKCLYHIRHWRTHNTLEKNKYHASDYRDKLAELYQSDDYYSVLPTWERPVNKTIPQSKSGQFNPVENNIVKSMSSKSTPDKDHDHDDYFKNRFPVKLKEHLATWYGFRGVKLDEVRKLLYEEGIAPEVVCWIAGKAVDNADKSPMGYFRGVIEDKCRGQGCKTLEKLLEIEGGETMEKNRILQEAKKIDAIRADIEEEWQKELPY